MMTFSNDPQYRQFIRVLADILTAPAGKRGASQPTEESNADHLAQRGSPRLERFERPGDFVVACQAEGPPKAAA
jgi:hypothetical protein